MNSGCLGSATCICQKSEDSISDAGCRIYTAVSSESDLVWIAPASPGMGLAGLTSMPALDIETAEINHATLSHRKGDSTELPERRLVARFSAADVDEPGGSAFSPLSSAGRSGGHFVGSSTRCRNSGEFRARSWKRALLRLRRVIASSAFVKKQLVNAGSRKRRSRCDIWA